MTSDPPGQVARALQSLAAFVDEIVVGVDSRIPVQTLAPLRDVADKLLQFEFRAPVDRPRAWLASHCAGDWLFWLDGDEIPSPEIGPRLRELSLARDVLQYAFTRRWLYGDRSRWLNENPWWPDFQIRMVRNDPASLWFGLTHVPIGPAPPIRYLDLPIYHLAALAPRAVRERKIEAYERDLPGMVSPAGGPFNEILFTPETHARLAPVAVPDAHRRLIDAVVDASRAAIPPADVQVVRASPNEIDKLSPARRLHDDDYRADIACLDADTRFAPGVGRSLLLQISNKGRSWWPWGGDKPPIVNVGYHLLDMDGETIVFDGRRTALPSNLYPGDTILLPVGVDPPDAEGEFVVAFDLVHEHVRWFGSEAKTPISVRRQRRDPG